MTEIRKADILGYEGVYEVHSNGKVWSVFYNDYLAIPKENKYHGVVLSHRGVKKTISVHRLVATAFIPNPNKKRTVNHKNGLKWDNRVENLEWATYSENLTHAFSSGLISVGSGKDNPMFGRRGRNANASKPVNKIHPEKNKIIKKYESVTQAAKDHGVVPSAIINCCVGLSLSSAGFKWEYFNK